LYEEKCGLNFPDFIVFDLDPYIYSGKEKKGEEPQYSVTGFKAPVDIAHELKDTFKDLKIKSYSKTSGKSGIHIYVPVANIYTYDQTKSFAEAIAKSMADRFPKKVTLEWSIAKRKGKIFFDYNQNAREKLYRRFTRCGLLVTPMYRCQLTGIKLTIFFRLILRLPIHWILFASMMLGTEFSMLNKIFED
jgi:hypothetical protein